MFMLSNNRNSKLDIVITIAITVALVVLVGLTVREASATSAVIAHENSASQASSECASLPTRSSIHTIYVKEMGSWMPYTEDGPTGFDGGLIHLLSMYRTCSR